MLESAFTPKVRSKFCKRDRYEGPQSCTSLRRSWHLKESCGLSQTFIAVILVWCDNHVPDMRNISKTGQLHPCIGSKTNWPRANCWSCTLQHFIWPWQEWNKMDLSSFHCHCSWLALLALSKGCVPSCFHHMCHELTFSVSPTDDGLCSCQQASFEVHLRQVDTKPGFIPTALPIPGSPLRPSGSASGFSGSCGSTWIDAKLAEAAFHRATVES